MCLDECILCGGVLIPFQYVRELKKRGYEADIYANGQLEGYAPTKPISELEKFTDDDVIIAVWWVQCDELLKFKGRKIQFVQGNDLESYTGSDWKEKCLKTRQDKRWEIMAVSSYAGMWTGRLFAIIPNFVDGRFFKDLKLERDIDCLIEGNYEENKQIDETIKIAKKIGGKIVWFGRETHPIDGVETITNPPQEEIPAIYQRAKTFIKLSKHEGFSLPILEAMASKCLVITRNMGGNTFCEYGKNCLEVDSPFENRDKIVKAGYKTAQEHNIAHSTDLLESKAT